MHRDTYCDVVICERGICEVSVANDEMPRPDLEEYLLGYGYGTEDARFIADEYHREGLEAMLKTMGKWETYEGIDELREVLGHWKSGDLVGTWFSECTDDWVR